MRIRKRRGAGWDRTSELATKNEEEEEEGQGGGGENGENGTM